ncbi:hypothetical protein HAZT_HAZT006707 [Hyalella azteca]|uniref:UBC core domain-containing protein n=1 Tax=Hyalella azteca TaxID=294128 RepID=A0A6A0H7R4_HYAAZ|nr:hypothetical protein HAZT_HAZT006707 [Hyalella azteca]
MVAHNECRANAPAESPALSIKSFKGAVHAAASLATKGLSEDSNGRGTVDCIAPVSSMRGDHMKRVRSRRLMKEFQELTKISQSTPNPVFSVALVNDCLFEWKGFVMEGGAICMELLTPRGWASAYTIEAIIMQLAASLVKGHDFNQKAAEASFRSLVRTHEKYGWVTPPLADG